MEPAGNVWVAKLLRYTNDGTLQQSTQVGWVSVTLLAEDDAIFSFVLFGEDGSDRERPSLAFTCPTIDDTTRSYNGVWSRAAVGVGGATAVVNATSQAFLHYIYDDSGVPVWLMAAPSPQSATATELNLLQWSGYCAFCTGDAPTNQTVGLFTREFSSETTANWTLDYVFAPPLSGSVTRTEDASKLTAQLACP